MIKPIEFDGMIFGKTEITEMRELIIELRNSALVETRFDLAVPLSHVIVVLAHVMNSMDETDSENEIKRLEGLLIRSVDHATGFRKRAEKAEKIIDSCLKSMRYFS